MLVKKRDAEVFQKPTAIVLEYGGTPNLDLAVVEIKDRYPEKGWARNTKVEMTYFVIEGKGKFYLEDEVFSLDIGDLVMIEKGKWYRVEGKMEVVMVSSPAWSPGQYEEKDER